MALQIRGNSQIKNGTIENDQISSSASISLSKLSLSDGSVNFSGDLTFSGSNSHTGTLDISSGTLTLANDQISGDKVEGGTIASITINSLASGSVNIDGGNIDGTAIGATSASTGSFTTLESSGNLTVGGDLTVNGTTTTINSTTLEVDDKTIILNKGSVDSATGDGGGLIIEGPTNDAKITWDHNLGSGRFKVNQNVLIEGSLGIESHLTSYAGNLSVLNGSNTTTFSVTASNGAVVGGSFNDGTATMSSGTLSGLSSVTSSTFQNAASDASFSVSSAGAVSASSLSDGTASLSSGSMSGLVNVTASGQVEFGTLSDGTISILSFVDEDNMASDSNQMIPTQQSVKAYVDSQVSSGGLSNLEAKDMQMVDSTGSFIKVKEEIEYVDLDATDAGNNYVDLTVAADSEFDELSMVFLNGQKLRFGDSSTNDYYIANDDASAFKRLHINGDIIENGDVLEVRYFVKS